VSLISIKYAQHAGDPEHWEFDGLRFGNVNLIVGMNASGKTRTLNVLNAIAGLVAGQRSLSAMKCDAVFADGESSIRYTLIASDTKIVRERLTCDGEELLRRSATGRGKIKAVRLNQTIDFKIPQDQLAVVAKRDNAQHPFLEPMRAWAESVLHLRCGTDMGKRQLGIPGEGATVRNVTDPSSTMPIITFLAGINKFGKRKFMFPIRRAMKAVGYPLSDISVGPPISIRTSVAGMVGLRVKERDLQCETDQHAMSQGMFRALATFIQVQYALLDNPASWILIDDIGEGLDYERASAVISFLRQMALESGATLVMATNDRFVMNGVPLDEWQIIQRKGATVRFFNQKNSPKAFSEFEYTGMSNFDFFRTGWYAEGHNGHK
jgi:energy-coupling factor transporter ATP-binding protein EcfA2